MPAVPPTWASAGCIVSSCNKKRLAPNNIECITRAQQTARHKGAGRDYNAQVRVL